MQIHMIGNGASNRFFNEQYGFRIMCNIPKLQKSADVISIIDQKVVLFQKNTNYQFKPSQVIWCTEGISRFARQHKLKGDWQPVFETKHRYNSGHLAIQHVCVTSPNIKIVHMWGMDSMFTDDLTSQMDDRVQRPQRPPLNNEWRPNWKTVFAQSPLIQFIIHATPHQNPYNYGSNVKTQIHQD